MFLYWLCAISFLIIFNSIQIKLSRSMFCSKLSPWLTVVTTFIQAILASSFAKKDYEKAMATASRVLQVCWFSRLIIFYGAFPILCCLWFCNAVGLGSGGSAFIQPCSCITICVQIIYKGHQCSATHRSKHPGIPSLPPSLNQNNVLFQFTWFPIILVVLVI